MRAPWRWHDSVEACSRVTIYKLIIIVLLLVVLQNNQVIVFQMLGDNSSMRWLFCCLFCVCPHSVCVVVVVVVVKYCFCCVILQCDDNSMAAITLQKTGLIDEVRNSPHSEPFYFSSPLLVFLVSHLILFYHLLPGLQEVSFRGTFQAHILCH